MCEYLGLPKGVDFVEEYIYESHYSSSNMDEKELNCDEDVEEIKLKRVEPSNNNSMSSLSSSSKSTSTRRHCAAKTGEIFLCECAC